MSDGELAELRRVVLSHLSSSSLSAFLAAPAASQSALIDSMDSAGLIAKIASEIGSVEKVLSKQREQNTRAGFGSEHYSYRTLAAAPSPTNRFLHMELLGGRGFSDAIVFGNERLLIVASIMFNGQRRYSAAVPFGCEPLIKDSFMLSLEDPTDSVAPGAGVLLSMGEPVALALTLVHEDGSRSLLGSTTLDWRKALVRGSHSESIEVFGIGAESKIPVGIVDVRLSLLPFVRAFSEQDVTAAIKVEHARLSELERKFFTYARAWWKEFVQLRSSHSMRLVKIFATADDGSSKSVCDFVRPLRAARLLESPRHAARFVSLIPFERDELAGVKSEVWHSLHNFLAAGHGDSEDHSVLLCSLLLGFGLDAYVCIGTRVDSGPHVWVLTRSADGSNIVFWESLTGARYKHVTDPSRVSHLYSTIDCIFSHNSFYANIQQDNGVLVSSFDLSNPGFWKSMDPSFIPGFTHNSTEHRAPPPLCVAPSSAHPDSRHLETELRRITREHRSREYSLETQFDDNISYLLYPALSAYELERTTGVSVGDEEFRDSMIRMIPPGFTFKGFPIQFSHGDPNRIISTILKHEVGRQILQSIGSQMRFGIAVKVYNFPERVSAVWVLIAVCYVSEDSAAASVSASIPTRNRLNGFAAPPQAPSASSLNGGVPLPSRS